MTMRTLLLDNYEVIRAWLRVLLAAEQGGASAGSSPGHLAWATDQRIVDGLLFERHRRASILLEEPGPQTDPLSP